MFWEVVITNRIRHIIIIISIAYFHVTCLMYAMNGVLPWGAYCSTVELHLSAAIKYLKFRDVGTHAASNNLATSVLAGYLGKQPLEIV